MLFLEFQDKLSQVFITRGKLIMGFIQDFFKRIIFSYYGSKTNNTPRIEIYL